jgi:8-oxo-dGTP diphosphatase
MKENENLRPRVGIGIMIFRNGKILLGKRKGSHGAGEWAFPGGHLEYMESFEKCALREIAEECGIKIKNIRFEFLGNIVKYSPKHYVHIQLIADWKSGEAKVLEPEKCEKWEWFSLNKLPSPLFEMTRLAVEFHKTGQNYLDSK